MIWVPLDRFDMGVANTVNSLIGTCMYNLNLNCSKYEWVSQDVLMYFGYKRLSLSRSRVILSFSFM